MSERDVTLDLGSLPDQCELLADTCRSIAAAACVRLAQLRGERDADPVRVAGDGLDRTGTIARMPVDEKAHATYADPEEATEEGAEAIAILVARQLLDRIVFRRLPKRTGADYRMRAVQSTGGDDYERLECSGIGDGDESGPARLREKLTQLASHQAHRPGHAVVTRFGREPVEVHIGRHRP